MGDHVYTSYGERRYIRLHDQVLRRPWTAKRRHQREADKAYDVSDIHSTSPHSPHLLGKIERISQALRRELMISRTLSNLTEDGDDEDGPEKAKQRIERTKHSVSEALSECATKLMADLAQIKRLNEKTSRLTLKRDEWWEGHNMFGCDIVSDQSKTVTRLAHEIQLDTSAKVATYVAYMEKCLCETLDVIKNSQYSSRSKTQFLGRLLNEFERVLYKTERGFVITTQTEFGYQHLFHYGLLILVDVLLAHPLDFPPAVRRRYESRVHKHFNTVLKRMGTDALYGQSITNRRLQRRNIAGGARRMGGRMDTYRCGKDDCAHKPFAITYSHLLRLARREVASRVYICVGQRLPAELCDIIVDAAYKAEGIEQNPVSVRKARRCPRPTGFYYSAFDVGFLDSGPEDSEQPYGSDVPSEVSDEPHAQARRYSSFLSAFMTPTLASKQRRL